MVGDDQAAKKPGEEPPAVLFPGVSAWKAVIAVLIAGFLFHQLQIALLPFVLAGILAFVVTPAVNGLALRTNGPRRLAASLVLIALFLVLGAVLGFGIPPLIRASIALASDLRGTIEHVIAGVIGSGSIELSGRAMTAAELADHAVTAIRDWLSHGEKMLMFAGASFGGMIGFILTAVVLCFLVLDGPRIGQGLLWLVPPAQRESVAYLARRIDPALKRYFVGLGIVVLYSSSVAYLSLHYILDLQPALVLGVLTGVLEVIPFVGPVTAAVIVGLVAVKSATGIWSIVAYAVYAILLRLSIDQIIAPIVLGRAGHIHPLVVILGFLVGGAFFGLAGVILAVPAAVCLKVVLEALYRD